MAELLATMVVGPLVSMVKEKASSYLLDQYQVMKGMEEQHEVLKRKLPVILDVMIDAEEKAAMHREGAKVWLEAVRKVAYKANDVLDEFKYEALRRKARAEGHYKALGMDVIKLLPTHNRVAFRSKMANRLHMIVRDLDVLIREMKVFRFEFRPQGPIPMQWKQTDACINNDSLDVASRSRDRAKMELVHRLLAEANSSDLTVVPVVGMGGLGKTTLAQLIYNDPKIQKHFQLQLWVYVSGEFDMNSLADKIVKENGCVTSGSSALDRLQNAVSGKRYLLVLDDVWNCVELNKWEKLKSYLQHGDRGSSVLITTRDEAVVKIVMGTTEGAYGLQGLDEDFIREIILTRISSSKQEEEWHHVEFLEMVDKVVSRCAGSPLLAKALGSLLGTKTTLGEWHAVLSRSMIWDEEDKILSLFKFSYNGFMRQCFAFCAMFPKDYEIDVEMLIQLWMANGFIPEKQGQHPEIIGKSIFYDLASRSFFQNVKGIPFHFNHTMVSRVTCKIHDLMHDAAMDSMGNECATITTKQSKSRGFPYSARHLFLSVHQPETFLNASLKKRSPAFQTLICDGYVNEDIKILSKYNSIRALKINRVSTIRPKYLQHLRYLDLSNSDIKALPKDISILYLLQTLNLSDCYNLERLPKQLKYLTCLRHLYTHGCRKLKSMPPELRHLTSLQTLTCFVAGTHSGCSNVGEMQNLDLSGKLELSQLENVTGEGAQAACLVNKKKLTELKLRWTDCDMKAQNNNDEEVMEGLKPHDGLKVLRIYSCGSSTFPAWVNTLNDMVELELGDCKRVEKLPPLWQLRALQVLRLVGLESVYCFCSGGITFKELKVLSLLSMPKLKTWWDTNEVAEEPIFPKVEELEIHECGSLTALPKAAPVISGVETKCKCRSAFPALRKMILRDLTMFDRWEAVEGTLEEEVLFPQLEELSIVSCESLSALPNGSLLVEQSIGEAETVCRCSAFPALRKLELSGLSALEKWGQVQGTPGEEVTFPELENLRINGCPKLTDLPEAPKLSALTIDGGRGQQQISLQGASRCIPSLSSLTLDVSTDDTEATLLHVKQKWNGKLPLAAMTLTRSNLLFSSYSSVLPLWTCFANLVDLKIWECDALVYWPENVFQILGSLRKLSIWQCSKLTGCTQISDDQSAPALELGGFLPCLEYLKISDCASLVELPTLPASLKTLSIDRCDKVETLDIRPRLVSEEGVERPDVLKLSFLSIGHCNSLSEIANLPPSIKNLDIGGCHNLQSLSGQLDAVQKLAIQSCSRLKSLESCFRELRSLEELNLSGCKSLVSLPDRPQAYSSLRVLVIKYCDGTKFLPPSLTSRLVYLEEKELDGRYEEPKTRKCAVRSLVCSK
ncbi:unnamed protein product [Urochloa humidicola]